MQAIRSSTHILYTPSSEAFICPEDMLKLKGEEEALRRHGVHQHKYCTQLPGSDTSLFWIPGRKDSSLNENTVH